jgi:hypothetical protein
MKKKIRSTLPLLAIAFFAGLFTSCASVPRADKATENEALQFNPVPGKSVIYVYRNELFGGAVGMDIFIDNQNIGGTAGRNFLWIKTNPGDHIIASKAENRDVLKLKTEAGKIYYIWQEAKMGVITARTKLTLVDENEGQSGVRDCELVVHDQPE